MEACNTVTFSSSWRFKSPLLHSQREYFLPLCSLIRFYCYNGFLKTFLMLPDAIVKVKHAI